MIKRAALAILLLCGLTAAARAAASGADGSDAEIVPNRETPGGVRRAAQDVAEDQDQTPAALRWILKPIKRGMFVRLPIIDSDPNRGITYGIIPIVVLQGENDERIL